MSELPKSVVIGGRRYPTWALSVRARESLVNLNRVDDHIAQLRQRLALYSAARTACHQQLLKSLPEQPRPAPRYYWHSVPQEWAQARWPVKAPTLELSLNAARDYQPGDRLFVYVKGYGVVGCGAVEYGVAGNEKGDGVVEKGAQAAPVQLAWRFKVAQLKDALPASTLKQFAVRHPNRASQKLPEAADIAGLLQALTARPAA